MSMDSNKIPWILFEFEKKPRGFFSRQLGLGDRKNNVIFQKLIMQDVKLVSCGGYSTFILTKDICFGCGLVVV